MITLRKGWNTDTAAGCSWRDDATNPRHFWFIGTDDVPGGRYVVDYCGPWFTSPNGYTLAMEYRAVRTYATADEARDAVDCGRAFSDGNNARLIRR